MARPYSFLSRCLDISEQTAIAALQLVREKKFWGPRRQSLPRLRWGSNGSAEDEELFCALKDAARCTWQVWFKREGRSEDGNAS